ncbi:MAG: RIP metalloprotease RseP [Bacteroidota bacterium]|nr:RIP metalloprotease RseP [Bacteroidota bacterium]
MEFANQIFYFLIIISILVLVHELGHFATAKLFRMRVDRFSIGLGPRAFGRRFGETDYCVSWIPFGGYVKIAGMIDESFDTEFRNRPPQPWEFRSKPVWQRLIVISAGVGMNVVLAVILFSALIMNRGRELHSVTTVGRVQDSTLAASVGFRPMDRITAVNGSPVTAWEEIEQNIAIEGAEKDVVVDLVRGDTAKKITLRKTDVASLDGKQLGLIPIGSRPLITSVDPDRPAAAAGLAAGDRIVSIADTEVFVHSEVIALLGHYRGKPTRITWVREGHEMEGLVTPDENGKIGIVITTDIEGPRRTIHYGFFEALGIGAGSAWTLTRLTVLNIWQIITGKASFRESIGGPVKIAKIAAQQAEIGIASFLSLVAVLSISLAVINLFPIPALDGGYLIFLLFELITRREIPAKVQISLLNAGWVLLIGLMALVLYNDIFH